MDKRTKKGFLGSIALTCLIISGSVVAEIYKWVDAEGNVHFSDNKSASQTARPVQLKSNINSYNGSALPKYEDNRAAGKKTRTKNRLNTLPRLGPKRVIMYSTRWCGFCKKAKAYFKQKGIAFSERDIEASSQANKEYQSYGGGGVPLILVGSKRGTRKLSGFSIARFDAAYK